MFSLVSRKFLAMRNITLYSVLWIKSNNGTFFALQMKLFDPIFFSNYMQMWKSAILAIFQAGPGWPCSVSAALHLSMWPSPYFQTLQQAEVKMTFGDALRGNWTPVLWSNTSSKQNISISPLHCTEVCFASFLSVGFTTMTVINTLEN